MKKTLTAAAVTAGLLALSSAGAYAGGKHHHHHHAVQVGTVQVTVSCYRGPWERVIWDRPNSIFVESLVDAGYEYSEAHAIAERVCRDQRGVGNPDELREAVRGALRQEPPSALRVRR